jgi:hypothetical protein
MIDETASQKEIQCHSPTVGHGKRHNSDETACKEKNAVTHYLFIM